MGSGPTSAAGAPGPGRYRFDGIVVDAAARSLSRDGHPQPLEPKAFAVLLELLAHPGELVTREQLLDAVWGHRHVTPGVLTRAIAQLRTAMADDPHHPRFIQTRHGLGYCFIGAPAPAPEPEPEDEEVVRTRRLERRRADRIAHRRWVLLAVILAAVLVVVLGAMFWQPATGPGKAGVGALAEAHRQAA